MKKINYEMIFPLLMVYVAAPIVYGLFPAFFEYFKLGMIFLPAWWVLEYYDENIKTAMKWIVRYIFILIPIWIVYYLINIGSDNSFVYLYALILNVLSAPVSGLFAFAVRKKTSGPEVVMVLIAIFCMIFSFDGIMFIV